MKVPRPALRSLRIVLPILVAADVVILLTGISWLRLVAGLALLFVLPGVTWLQTLGWLDSRQAVERVVLTGGLSAAISSVVLLAAAYWPAPLDLTQVLVALNVAVLSGVVAGLAGSLGRPGTAPGQHRKVEWPVLRVLVILLVILGVAMFLRTYSLGYGEFHEDELENMRLAVRAMKGEEYAPFLDSKGPIHWLLPAALWLMHGWLNEALARSIFVICSGLTVLGVFVLGRRMFGQTVGLLAAGFVAANGLLVAYARHVEAPSIIVLWGMLAAWCGYEIYARRNSPGPETQRLEIVGWFLLGIGVVAHPNMVLYLLPFVLLLAYTYLKLGRGSVLLWRAQRGGHSHRRGTFPWAGGGFLCALRSGPGFQTCHRVLRRRTGWYELPLQRRRRAA